MYVHIPFSLGYIHKDRLGKPHGISRGCVYYLSLLGIVIDELMDD